MFDGLDGNGRDVFGGELAPDDEVRGRPSASTTRAATT